MSEATLPRLSVVVPVRNEARYLRECLGSLLQQRYDPHRYEVLIVDGGSNDGTAAIAAELAAQHPNVRVLGNPGRIVSCGRNVGIRASRGDIVAFVEGHAFVGPDFLAQIEAAFQDEAVQCLGRLVEQYLPGDSALQQAIGLLRKAPLGRNPHSLRFTAGSAELADPSSIATVYRRAVFDTVGLYDEGLTTNEDVELNWRVRQAGIKALRLPGLTYFLHPRHTLRGFWTQLYRYGYGKALLVRRHPRAFRLAYAAPSGLVVLALLGAALAEARVCLVPLAAYLALSLLSAFRPPVGGGRRYPGLRLLLSALLVFAFGIGFLAGAVGRNRMAPRAGADAARPLLPGATTGDGGMPPRPASPPREEAKV